MKPLKFTVFLLFSVVALCGCSTLGLQGMTEGQIRASAGVITCSQYESLIYGNASFIAMNADDVKKSATATSDITINCGKATLTSKGTAGVPVPAGATTTTTTTVVPAK